MTRTCFRKKNEETVKLRCFRYPIGRHENIYKKQTFTLACFLSMESNPAILFPFVSIKEPIGSQVMTSHVCFGKGSNCRTLSILSDLLSPSSF